MHLASAEQTARQEQVLQQLQPKFCWVYLLNISYSIQFPSTQLAELAVGLLCLWAISSQISLSQGSEQASDIHIFKLWFAEV